MIEIACIGINNVFFNNFKHSSMNITYFDSASKIKYDEFSIILLINHYSFNVREMIKNVRSSFTSIIYFIDIEYNEKIMSDLYSCGIDDYLVVPIYPKYLINKILHDTGVFYPETLDKYQYKALVVDYKNCRAMIMQIDVSLTMKEYLILELLVRNVNNVVSKQDLISCVWGSYNETYLKTLDTHIKTLRKKLKDYRENVVTLWNRGYAFMERK